MDLIDFSIQQRQSSSALLKVRANLLELSAQQNFVTFIQPNNQFWIVDIQDVTNFSVLAKGRCPNAIAATCFLPSALVDSPTAHKIVLHLNTDSIVMQALGSAVNRVFRLKSHLDFSFFGKLFVARDQRVYFAGRSDKALGIFCFDGTSIAPVVTNLVDHSANFSGVVISEFNEGSSLIVCQGHLVRFINLNLRVLEHEFLLAFAPSACSVFGSRVLSFFNENTNSVHNIAVDKDIHSSVSSMSIISLGDKQEDLQCMQCEEDSFYVWNGKTRVFFRFPVDCRFIPVSIDSKSFSVGLPKSHREGTPSLQANCLPCVGTTSLFPVPMSSVISPVPVSAIFESPLDTEALSPKPLEIPAVVASSSSSFTPSPPSELLSSEETEQELRNFAESFLSPSSNDLSDDEEESSSFREMVDQSVVSILPELPELIDPSELHNFSMFSGPGLDLVNDRYNLHFEENYLDEHSPEETVAIPFSDEEQDDFAGFLSAESLARNQFVPTSQVATQFTHTEVSEEDVVLARVLLAEQLQVILDHHLSRLNTHQSASPSSSDAQEKESVRVLKVPALAQASLKGKVEGPQTLSREFPIHQLN